MHFFYRIKYLTFVYCYTDYARLFAVQITRTAKDIDSLIDSLPTDETTAEVQVST